MQRTTSSRESSGNEMNSHFQLQSTSSTNQPGQHSETRLTHSENISHYQRFIRHNQLQQYDRQQQYHQVEQTGPVSFGIYTSPQQQAPSTAISSAHQSSYTSSGMPSATPTHLVVEEATTTVKVPMLQPKPALLKVIHLSGGVGETFTMGEVINHVKNYIRERILYDQQDPRIVHCGGDLLGVALGVDTFTVHDAIGLFHKNCVIVPDSYIRIYRHLVSRPVNPLQQTTSGGGAASHATSSGTATATAASAPSSRPDHLRPQTSSVTDVGSPQTTGSSTTQPASSQNASQSSQGAHSISSTSSSFSSSLPSSSSSSSSAVIKFRAAQSFVTVTDSDLEKSNGEQASHSDSSSNGGGDRYSRQHRRKGLEKSNAQRRARRTSINVNYDEPDGATSPWTCEVMMETSAGEMAKPENDTLVFEFDSDAFSVEYDVESDPEVNVDGNKPADAACNESDESSSTSGAGAILVVCKESDVEYLADYSDSDNGSNAEFSDADKWGCEYCKEKNPPFQRNCGGCWSVRPDWLPSSSEEKGGGAANDKPDTDLLSQNSKETGVRLKLDGQDDVVTISSGTGNLDSFPLQSQEDAKEVLNSSQDQSSYVHKQNTSPCKNSSSANFVQRRRKCSSSLSTSDSQDGKKKEKTESTGKSLSDASQIIEKNKSENASVPKDDPCVVCLTRRKTASIIHGKTGHQVCCYRCARRLKKQRKSCPICRRPIQKVIRNFQL